MTRGRWPVLALILLLVGLVAALCLTCAGAAWLLSRPGTGGSLDQPSAGLADGGTLRLFGAEPRTLDPALVRYTVSAEYVVEIFSGLVSLDGDLRVVPDLAESWEVSPDGRSYTFFLREGGSFHNGRAVTAADFKYSLERACHPRTGSVVAAVYLGDIVGAEDVLSGHAEEMRGVEVVNDRTLRITIDEPKAYFLAKLTYSTAFVVDRDNVESSDWFQRPNGTGPFGLAEYSSERIVLERNELYYRDKPGLEQVVFWFSGGSPMSMYENGELDMVGVSPADVERVRDPANPLHADLSTVPQLDIYYLGFDVSQPPFDDVKVRQAFALAVDRRKLTDVVLKGMGYPAEGIVPPGMPGYERERPLLSFDASLAQRLIGESTYGSVDRLPPVTLRIGGSSGELPAHIEALVAMYRENLGLEVGVEQSEDIFAGKPQLFASGWSADYPDPENFLDILFHSQSELNRMSYANPELDRLLQETRTEQDMSRRMELYRQAEEIIVADAPWVPLWHNVDYVLTKPYVRGAVFAAAIFPWLANVGVTQ